MNVQFSLPSNRGRGCGVDVYPNLAFSIIEACVVGAPMRGAYKVDPRWCRGRWETLDRTGSMFTTVRGSWMDGGTLSPEADVRDG